MTFAEDDDTPDLPPWNPNAIQMTAYRRREAEMAKDNIQGLWWDNGRPPKPEDTLHSPQGFFDGFQALLSDPGPA